VRTYRRKKGAGEMQRELKFRQPIFNEDGSFRLWAYWGFMDDLFLSPSEATDSYQYTGLKDKNGNEAYHKDIAHDVLTKSLFVIEWNEGNGRYQLVPVDLPKTFHYIREVESILDMEVIGNIFMNPELLEAKGLVK